MSVSLLTHDPQPSVILDAAGTPLTVNPALSRLLAGKPLEAVRPLLPGNIDELVRACLQQGRAIEQVHMASIMRGLAISHRTQNRLRPGPSAGPRGA